MLCCVRPASVQPQKNYNVLVRDLFPVKALPLAEPVSDATKKKIQKLSEYANNNPDKIPKISRRLSRKMRQSFVRVDDYGHLRTAVYAYCVLLSNCQQDQANYTSSFFEEELLNGNSALVPPLLHHDHPQIRAFGADLLSAYTRVQDGPDTLDKIEAFVPTICGLINKSPPGSGGAKGGAEGTELLACLLFLQEYVLLCQRLRQLPKYLHVITGCVLDNLGDSGGAAVSPSAQSRVSEVPMLGASTSGTLRQSPSDVARGILHLFNNFMSDLANVQPMTAAMLRYLNDRHKWHQQDLVQDVLQMLRSASPEQHFLLYTTLLEHAADRSRTVDECYIITQRACQEGMSQRTALATLSQALQQLPVVYMSAVQRKGADPLLLEQLKTCILEGCNALACKVCDVSQLCEALGGSLRTLSDRSEQSMVGLECCLAAVQALHQLPEEDRKLVANRIPTTVLEPLCSILATWPPVPRSYAYTILLTILQYNPKTAGDDVTAATILDALWAQLALPDSLPAHFEAMCAVLQACIAAARASSVTLLVRFMISLGREVMQVRGRFQHTSKARVCAVLELLNCLVNSLSSACNLPDLVRVPVENSCPAVRVRGGRLVAEAHDFANHMHEKMAEALLNILDSRFNVQEWAHIIVGEVCKISALQHEFGDNLPAVLLAHFDGFSERKQGAPSSQQPDMAPSKAILVDKLMHGNFDRSDSNMVMTHPPAPRLADLIRDDDSFSSHDVPPPASRRNPLLDSTSSSLRLPPSGANGTAAAGAASGGSMNGNDPDVQRLLNVLQMTRVPSTENGDVQFRAIMQELNAQGAR